MAFVYNISNLLSSEQYVATEHRLSKILNQKHPITFAQKHQPSLIKVNPQCPVYLYVSGLRKKSSQATARSVLQSIARHLKQQSIADITWAKFDLDSMNQLIVILETAELAPDTIVLYAAIIKGVVKKAYLLEQISQLHYERLCSVNLPLGGSKKEHQIIEFDQFDLFLSQFIGRLNAKRRNMAIFSLLIGCGLRRFELTNLMISNLDLVNKRLRFRGKGGKIRQVAMHQKTMIALQAWLDVRGMINGPVFLRVYKNDRIDNSYQLKNPDQHLTDFCLSNTSIYQMCQKFGLINDQRHIPPHSIRRSYATRLYNNQIDLKTIASLMGHSSIKTTEIYVNISQDQMDDAISNLF